MGAGRDLKSSDVAPAKIHPIVAEIRTAAEIFTRDQTVTGTYGQLGLNVRVTNRHDKFIGFGWLFVNLFLDRCVFLIDDDRRNGMCKSIGQLSRAVSVVFPTEHFVDHAHVTKKVGDAAIFRLSFDIVE